MKRFIVFILGFIAILIIIGCTAGRLPKMNMSKMQTKHSDREISMMHGLIIKWLFHIIPKARR